MTHTLKEADLAQFHGTENWYKHPLSRSITYTDGVQYVAEHGGAYWLLNEIILLQTEPKLKPRVNDVVLVRSEPFQVCKLRVLFGSAAVLTCGDGNNNTVYIKDIPFTDFPLPEIEIWLENNVMMLPGER